ncbi:MAG TPA: M14 family zinc carboxypeptidase [Solirubrobacterales bacterium]|nr:M14 family zinc carboxypeptidase [Solirubrobacterales bacterium]
MRTIANSLLPAILIAALACAGAEAKGLETMPAAGGVALERSPYRYVTMAPRHPAHGGRTTTLARVDREGGEIDRWWFLRGTWMTPSVAYDRSGGGLSADGHTLVLAAYRYAYPRPRRWESRFAIVDTRQIQGFDLDEPLRDTHPVRRFALRGDFRFAAVSPDGSTVYLYRHPQPGNPAINEVRAYDVAGGRLDPEPLFDPNRQRRRLEGMPVTAVADREGRWSYTLFDDGNGGGVPYLQALDTEAGEVVTVLLPQIARRPNPFLLDLSLGTGGNKVFLSAHSAAQGQPGTGPLLSIDTETFAVRRLGRGSMAFARTPRGPGNLLGRNKVIGHSLAGRPIALHQSGDPKWSGELLVFGCIHGGECAASEVQPVSSLSGGCPDPSADIYFLPNLNPDGALAGSRLNARGVDLNRNFPSGWKPIGTAWSPQYAGPRPFSEPETRLAAQVIRAVRPAATIWFHQYIGARPFVRAWGQSVAGGRRFAELARMPFRAMRWPAGTAPNWQNHNFRAAAFVVELPQGPLGARLRDRLSKAIVRMGRWVRED